MYIILEAQIKANIPPSLKYPIIHSSYFDPLCSLTISSATDIVSRIVKKRRVCPAIIAPRLTYMPSYVGAYMTHCTVESMRVVDDADFRSAQNYGGSPRLSWLK